MPWVEIADFPGDQPRKGRQVVQGADIDLALEGHHVLDRIPEIDPAPAVELGFLGQVQAQVAFLAVHPQQEPDLLLADAGRPRAPPHAARRQPITQPARRRPKHFDVLGIQPGLFPQLPVHGLQRGFIGVHAALRKLPAVPVDPAGPEQLTIRAHEHDAHVGAITVRIDHDRTPNSSLSGRLPQAGRGSQAACREIDTRAPDG